MTMAHPARPTGRAPSPAALTGVVSLLDEAQRELATIDLAALLDAQAHEREPGPMPGRLPGGATRRSEGPIRAAGPPPASTAAALVALGRPKVQGRLVTDRLEMRRRRLVRSLVVEAGSGQLYRLTHDGGPAGWRVAVRDDDHGVWRAPHYRRSRTAASSTVPTPPAAASPLAPARRLTTAPLPPPMDRSLPLATVEPPRKDAQ